MGGSRQQLSLDSFHYVFSAPDSLWSDVHQFTSDVVLE